MVSVLDTPDLDVIVTEIDIAAPVERVVQALTDPAQLIRWSGVLELLGKSGKLGSLF